jgi:diguanylate cyclase (GGDEF)-like protein
MAACAIENLRHQAEWSDHRAGAQPSGRTGAPPTRSAAPAACELHPSVLLHDATFLSAVLPFALSQSRRHREPLSLLCVAIDRLRGVQELLGRPTVDRLVRHIGETVATLVRSSDIVARLDDDRVVVVLPRAPGGGAFQVAQKICRAVAEKSQVGCEVPGLTVSIGVATFPTCAEDVYSLFDAADEALARAQSGGRNQPIMSPPRPTPAANPAPAQT